MDFKLKIELEKEYKLVKKFVKTVFISYRTESKQSAEKLANDFFKEYKPTITFL